MRLTKMFSVRRSDQGSGFRGPKSNNGVPCFHSQSTGIFVSNWDAITWLVAACHLSAQYEGVNSFEDYCLLDITLVYHPEEHMCLLSAPKIWVIRQLVDAVGRDR